MSDRVPEVTDVVVLAANKANDKFGKTDVGRKILSEEPIGEERTFGTLTLDLAEESAEAELKNKSLEKSIEDLKVENQLLEGQAKVDPLTNLSRKEELVKYLEENLVKGEPVTLIFIDIDHFRDVNNTYGHYVGDKVLQVLGDRLNNVFPKSAGNFLCRYGGEEFVVVMKGLSDENVGMKRAEQFRKLMEGSPITVNSAEDHKIIMNKTISAGVAVKDPNMSFEEWINEADRALYYAKENGRNRSIPVSTIPTDFKR